MHAIQKMRCPHSKDASRVDRGYWGSNPEPFLQPLGRPGPGHRDVEEHTCGRVELTAGAETRRVPWLGRQLELPDERWWTRPLGPYWFLLAVQQPGQLLLVLAATFT